MPTVSFRAANVNMSNTTAKFLLFFMLLGVEKGNCLRCLSCNVTMSARGSDPCLGISEEKECQPNSACLTSTFEVDSNPKSYRTIKSCYMNTGNTECEVLRDFLEVLQKAMKNLYPPTIRLAVLSCYSCNEDRCNSNDYKSSADRNIPSSLFLPLVVFLVSNYCTFN